MEVREIIIEAAARANVCPRRQPMKGDILEGAYKLLRGIVSKYNNDDYLAFTRSTLDLPARETIHIYDDTDTMLDPENRVFRNMTQLSENPPTSVDYADGALAYVADGAHENILFYVTSPMQDVYIWVPSAPTQEFDPRYQQMKAYADAYHVKVAGVSKLNTLMVNVPTATQQFLKLNFAPCAEFDKYLRNDPSWTFKELSEGEWIIRVKPYVCNSARKLRLDYNRAIRFDIDSDLRIPDAYIELLIVSLTHKLAKKYPRLDDAQMQRLEKDVTDMIENVRTPKADAREVVRDIGYGDDRSYWGVVAGTYLV